MAPAEHHWSGFDYTKAPLGIRIRKVLRYMRLYGISWTLAKVRGQYHMYAHYDPLPAGRKAGSGAGHVGLIGCGNFGFSTIAHLLTKEAGPVLRGVMDTDAHRAASLFERYRADYYTTDAGEVLSDPAIDLIYVASNHTSHAEYAIAAIEAGKAVHIEKPHVVNEDQLHRLLAAATAADAPRVRLGFNRPLAPLGLRVLAAMEAQKGSVMINWSVVGHQMPPDHWYLQPSEGGVVPGNLCHWTDFSLQMVPEDRRYPIRIIPGRDHPNDRNIAVSYVFADGSFAVITFSAKAYSLGGVREKLHVQTSDFLVSLTDFQELTIESGFRKERHRPLFRQHGHRQSVMGSYGMSARGGSTEGFDLHYVRQTAEFFLATRAALESNQEILLHDSPGAGIMNSCPTMTGNNRP